MGSDDWIDESFINTQQMTSMIPGRIILEKGSLTARTFLEENSGQILCVHIKNNYGDSVCVPVFAHRIDVDILITDATRTYGYCPSTRVKNVVSRSTCQTELFCCLQQTTSISLCLWQSKVLFLVDCRLRNKMAQLGTRKHASCQTNSQRSC